MGANSAREKQLITSLSTRPDIKVPQPFQGLDHPYHPLRPLCPVRYTQVLKMGKRFGIERIVHDAVANKIQAGDVE